MADNFDMKMHRGTYGGFLKLLTWGAVSVAILLILMGLFIA